MKRRGTAGGRSGKGTGAFGPKARTAPTAPISTGYSAEEFDRLGRERDEALAQQAATAEVLKVIASSPTNVQPVFDVIAQSAVRLFGGQSATVTRVVDDMLHLAALTAGSEAGIREVQSSFPSPLSSSGIHSRVARGGAPAFRSDIETEPDISQGVKELARARGYRSILVVPVLRDGVAIGTIGVTRREPGLFTDDQIDLLKTFADQAVIAIENVRLLNELRERTDDLAESLEQQTATSEVLQVISSSPGDLEPVFNAMLANATRICEADFGTMLLAEGDSLRRVALHNAPPKYVEYHKSAPVIQPKKMNITVLNQLIETKKIVHVADMMVEYAEDPIAVNAGARTLILVPMLKDNNFIGTIGIYRQEVRRFTDKQIALVTNFAAQAVIAIENTRLLNELRQRTDDLTESLERQTAISDVLGVISSSPSELGPVFHTMLESATRICDAKFGNLLLVEGDAFRMVALHGAPEAFAEERRREPIVRPPPGSDLDLIRHNKKIVHTADRLTDGRAASTAIVKLAGARTFLNVPMIKGNQLIGVVGIYRQEVRPFTDKQIELVSNFAAQAVIAIENARLLNELRQRTDDLTESLEQQTATSEVLQGYIKLAWQT